MSFNYIFFKNWYFVKINFLKFLEFYNFYKICFIEGFVKLNTLEIFELKNFRC